MSIFYHSCFAHKKIKDQKWFWTHLRSSNLQSWRFQFQVVCCNLILPYMYYFHFYRCVYVFVVCVYVCMCAWNKKNNWFMIGNAFIFCFPGSSEGKEFACSTGDLSSIPELRRSPGKGNGYPLQDYILLFSKTNILRKERKEMCIENCKILMK